MNNLSALLENLTMEEDADEYVTYEYVNVLQNPNKLPINEIFLERKSLEITQDCSKNITLSKLDAKFKERHVVTKTEIIPALDKRWIPEFIITFEFQEYDFNASEKENEYFITNNRNYVKFLKHLIKCNYHQFWCTILFNEEVRSALNDFLLNPIPQFRFRSLKPEFQDVYKVVFSNFYLVYRRVIFFRESKIEYMKKDVACKFLIDKKLLNLPIVTTLVMLYKNNDMELVSELGSLYFGNEDQRRFIEKEIEEMISHTILVFDMLKKHVMGFEPGDHIVPLSIEERPKVFSLAWIQSVVTYLLNMITILNSLFLVSKQSIDAAIEQSVPERMASTYEEIFTELYELLDDREELIQDPEVTDRLWQDIGLTRKEFVDTFNVFVSRCLEQTLENQGDPITQEKYVETYINFLTSVLEYEIFICDYNAKYDIALTNEMFESCSAIDSTRSKYIVTSISNFQRTDFLKDYKCSIETVFAKNLPRKTILPEPEACCSYVPPAKDNDVDEKINFIMGMLPHLGDGFIFECLKAYNFNTDEVINAILEENLPPHIIEIPFDMIRIPPEPEPPQPILAYKGKKPDYGDALHLLNDKTDKEKLKTFILDGIAYDMRYDNSEDEYDDRDVELAAPDYVPDYTTERYEKPNEDDLVSDASYSDNEYDDNGRPLDPKPKLKFPAFCEDPAIIRARYEAKRGGASRGGAPPPRSSGGGGGGAKPRDVVGKPKGQGQDKAVLNNRNKKNVNKSSRANHNRKSGAAWKQSRGMF